MDKKIVIIDDEQINLDFFDVMLSKLGFKVFLASNGEEGLSQIQRHIPDLIILDNIMPKLTGWELTKMLKQDTKYAKFRYIPIIMFSAMSSSKDKIEGFELGIDDYIAKPFNFTEVLARIRAVLRNHELSEQVVLREKRLAQTDSLSKSLMYFTNHFKQPIITLIELAKTLNSSDSQSIDTFKNQVLDESTKFLAALDGLEDEVKTLQQANVDVRKAELSLEELNKRFRQHLKDSHLAGDGAL